MQREFVEVLLRKFGEGRAGRGGGPAEDTHDLCAFFFFIKAVKSPGTAVAISSQAKLTWRFSVFSAPCQFEALGVCVLAQGVCILQEKRSQCIPGKQIHFCLARRSLSCLRWRWQVLGKPLGWIAGRMAPPKTSGDVQQWQGTASESSNWKENEKQILCKHSCQGAPGEVRNAGVMVWLGMEP